MNVPKLSIESQQALEGELIGRILAGETALFHQLIQPYERLIYLTVAGILRNEADAEDAAQETAIHAFRGLKSFRAEAKFSTWLTAIAINEARGKLRKAKRENLESLEQTTEENSGDFTPAFLMDWREIPSEALDSKELREQIRVAVEDLPGIYREVFLLRTMNEMSTDDTAKALSVSVEVVKVRLHRARMMLQKRLVKEIAMNKPVRRWGWISGRRP
jgi:RNA polymerase sigma-70 factor (ECF subfamily)